MGDTLGTTKSVTKDNKEVLNETVPALGTGLHRVRLDASRTINTGNYESTRIGVSIEVACDDVQQGYKYAEDFVNEKLGDALQDIYDEIEDSVNGQA